MTRSSELLKPLALISGVTLLLSGCSAPAASTDATSSADFGLTTQGSLTVCADISFPPFEFYDENQQPTGSDIDLAKAIAGEMNLTPVFKNVSFSGIVPALQAGQCDVIISGLFDTEERRQVLDFADYMKLGNVIVVREDHTDAYETVADLSGSVVGAEAGSGLAAELDAANKALPSPIQVQTFPKDSDALQQLLVGHIDAYYTTAATLAYYDLQSPGQVKAASPQLSVQKVGAATLKDNPALGSAIGEAVASLSASGKLTEIFTTWDLSDAEL